LVSEKEAIYCELLVLRCRRKEKAAFEELVRHWERQLFYYIRRLVENEQDAWDLLQQTWLKVFSGIRSLRDPRTLPTWLYRIARNTTISHLKAAGHGYRPLVVDGGQLDRAEADTNEFRFDDAERVRGCPECR